MNIRRSRKLESGQLGITGLETAIILIAFVVVASVFAYTVLSAGIFSSEKGKEAIYEGLDTARSSMEMVGAVVAKDNDSNDTVDQIVFVVANALAGEGLDFNVTTDTDNDGILSDEATKVHRTIINYLDKVQRIDDIKWTRTQLGRGDSDHLLEPGEKFRITVDIATALTSSLDAYETFTIQVTPDTGSTLIFERTMPAVIDDVMTLN